MSLRRRKKAIGKVVKLLNLATSTNSSESSMALRHAESIILQSGLSQGDIPLYQLCDRTMLFKVSWNGVPRHAKVSTSTATTESYTPRRFSEKPIDPNKAYASARTILDDLQEEPTATKSADVESSDYAGDAAVDIEMNIDSANAVPESQDSVETEALNDSMDNAFASGEVEQEATPAYSLDEEAAFEYSESVDEDGSQASCSDLDEEEVEFVGASMEQVELSEEDHEPVAEDVIRDEVDSSEVEEESEVSAERYFSHDNVIDAASAFRPSGEAFRETLRNQYASSNPDVPFEEDSYWSKVRGMLVDFDESEVLVEIDGLENQLVLAKESLKEKRSQRASVEQEEQRERSERARIEQSFEEAIERAFQARAKAYEAWEAKRSNMRISSLRAEQDAQQGYEELVTKLDGCKEQYAQHLQLKEDYRAAKIMHELRRHLSLAARGDSQAQESYEKVIAIMSESGLSLRDLEFSDIRNKSLFIRLLERESAQISDVHEREQYTEEMLDKFLLVSRQEPAKPSENPVEHVERLLKSIEGVGQFESQKVIEQVVRLMEAHQISVRDLNYGCINKYSVFVCLINWEAEQIHSLSEREKFTSSVLEEYVQYSVTNPRSSQKA